MTPPAAVTAIVSNGGPHDGMEVPRDRRRRIQPGLDPEGTHCPCGHAVALGAELALDSEPLPAHPAIALAAAQRESRLRRSLCDGLDAVPRKYGRHR